MGQHADLDAHRIEGFTRNSERVSVPLISHIDGDLWMGGCLPYVRLPDNLAWVLSLYDGAAYQVGSRTRVLSIPGFHDAPLIANPAKVHRLAELVLEMLTVGRTLVHCQAGLNRSGLVTALVLVKQGWAPADAIALLRERRSPLVLCNTVFERWILDLADGSDDQAAPGKTPPAGAGLDTAPAKDGDAPDAHVTSGSAALRPGAPTGTGS